jgi:hypothetical protein
MTRESLIRLRESATPGKVPLIEQLELAELATNTYDGRLYLKQETEEFERIITIVGKVPVKNTIFVQKNGEDRNNGDSWDSAVLTFERALELAALRDNELTLIDVGPGEYITQGHLDMPDNTLIRAAHRSVVIKPEEGYEEQNVFRMGSGCFIEGPVFEGWRLDDLDNPTEGFAVCFRPGAMITRVPYVHKVVVRSTRYWDTVAPPLDRKNANPLVGRGGGVVLADGAVLSPYSIFPNIMTWGATPVSHNGIGYCAKNGALINAVNAVSLWAHKHFYAIDGGQIVLSSCSTQFGDFTMVSKGTRNIVFPQEIEETSILNFSLVPVTTQSAAATTILAEKSNIIDDMWTELVAGNYTTGWTLDDETFTKRDAGLFVDAIVEALTIADQQPIENFISNLFYADQTSVFDIAKLPAFIFSFETMEQYINGLSISPSSQLIVTDLSNLVTDTLTTPDFDQVVLVADAVAAQAIVDNKQLIIDNLWSRLEDSGYTASWNQDDETFTRRDAGIFLQSISWVIQTANEKPMLDFVKGLFDYNGIPVFSQDKLTSFIVSFNFMKDQINNLLLVSAPTQRIVTALVTSLTTTLQNTQLRLEPSIITAIGHTWSGIMAGVALTKIPPARNLTNITESVLELNRGVVIASGQDDQGSALFVGGLEINADTGELSGPPFDQAVNRIATRAAIARSF